MPMTKGPWRVGIGRGSVVADHPIEGGPMGSNDVEGYGGHLIGESMSPDNAKAIAALPDLVDSVRGLIRLCVLVAHRDDLPEEAKTALLTHRAKFAADALIAELEENGALP